MCEIKMHISRNTFVVGGDSTDRAGKIEQATRERARSEVLEWGARIGMRGERAAGGANGGR
jgi:hypothetical protein